MADTTLTEATNHDTSYTSDGVVPKPLVTHHRDVENGVPHTIPLDKKHIISVRSEGSDCGMTIGQVVHHQFLGTNLLSPEDGASPYRLHTHARHRHPHYRY